MKHGCLLVSLLPFLSACVNNGEMPVAIINTSGLARSGEVVELSIDDIRDKLSGPYFYVVDASGNEIPSQLTYDKKLIFQADVDSNNKSEYRVLASDTVHEYKAVCVGRKYPEREDDIAWENELVGFRAYGPATQEKGERAYGYDIFFKYKDENPILEELYASQTSGDNWRKADSLKAIDPGVAQKFIESFTYHIDHGKGMDCYAVGPTAGDGMSAFYENDSILFAWCCQTAEVLDCGPVRFTVRLDFAPRTVGTDSAVVEHRIISLDRGSQLNHAKVWFEGLSEVRPISVGFPLRDSSAPVIEEMFIAYADPTQGSDNGKALLGVVQTTGFDITGVMDDHVFGARQFAPEDTLDYYWGYAWNRQGIENMSAWSKYLDDFSKIKTAPLEIIY